MSSEKAAPSARALAAKAAVAALRAKSTDSPAVFTAAAKQLGSTSLASSVLSGDTHYAASDARLDGAKVVMRSVKNDAQVAADGLKAKLTDANSFISRYNGIVDAITTADSAYLNYAGSGKVVTDAASMQAASESLLSDLKAQEGKWATELSHQTTQKLSEIRMHFALQQFQNAEYAACTQTLLSVLLADKHCVAAWLLRARAFTALRCKAGYLLAYLHVKKALSTLGIIADHAIDDLAKAGSETCANADGAAELETPILDCLNREYNMTGLCKNPKHNETSVEKCVGGDVEDACGGSEELMAQMVSTAAIAKDFQLITAAKTHQTASNNANKLGKTTECSDGHCHSHGCGGDSGHGHAHVDKNASCCVFPPLLQHITAHFTHILHMLYMHCKLYPRPIDELLHDLAQPSSGAEDLLVAQLLGKEGFFLSGALRSLINAHAALQNTGIIASGKPWSSCSSIREMLEETRGRVAVAVGAKGTGVDAGSGSEGDARKALSINANADNIILAIRGLLNFAQCCARVSSMWWEALVASDVAFTLSGFAWNNGMINEAHYVSFAAKALYRRGNAHSYLRTHSLAISDLQEAQSVLRKLEDRIVRQLTGTTVPTDHPLSTEEVSFVKSYVGSMLQDVKKALKTAVLMQRMDALDARASTTDPSKHAVAAS